MVGIMLNSNSSGVTYRVVSKKLSHPCKDACGANAVINQLVVGPLKSNVLPSASWWYLFIPSTWDIKQLELM